MLIADWSTIFASKNRRPIKMTGNSSLAHALIADWSTIFAGLCRSKILAQGYFGSSIEISSEVSNSFLTFRSDSCPFMKIDTTPFVGPKFLHMAILGPVLRIARNFQTAF